MRRSFVLCLALGYFLYAARPALAHDFWIEPTTFAPAVGETLGVALRVGHFGAGDPFVRKPERIVRFALCQSGAPEAPLSGSAGDNPAGRVTLSRPGAAVLVYQSNRARVTLAGPEFTAYLREEGLTRILARRAHRGETEKPANEAYSRCAKSLVLVGPETAKPSPSATDFRIGLPLELVGETVSRKTVTSASHRFRLLFRGKPLTGALVSAICLDGQTARATTDKTGRVTLSLKPGVWLVKSVHMIPAPPDAHADYESFWASLTFTVK